MHPLSSAVYFSAPKYKLIGKEKIWNTMQCKRFTTPNTHRLYRGAQFIKHWHCSSSFPTKHHQWILVMKSPTTTASLFLQNKTLYKSGPVQKYVLYYSWSCQNKLIKYILRCLTVDSFIFLPFTLEWMPQSLMPIGPGRQCRKGLRKYDITQKKKRHSKGWTRISKTRVTLG